MYSRPSDPRCRTASNDSRLISRPLTPVTRARSDRHQLRRPRPRRLARVEERSHSVDLRRQDLDQEHVGAARSELHRELLQQVRLQRADADDEEAPQADGEQDDARLVARPRQAQHRVAQRKRPRPRDRPDRVDDAAADQVQHEREAGETAADDRPDLERRRLPARDGDQRDADDHGGDRLRRIDRADPRADAGDRPPRWMARRRGEAGRGAAAQQQQRLHPAHFEQRHEREQQRHEHPDRDALPRRRRRSASTRWRRAPRRRASGIEAIATLASPTPSALPARPSSTTCSTYADSTCLRRRAEALQDRDALDLLANEDARDAPHADAAKHEHDEPDQAQVVFRAREVLADVVFDGPVGRRPGEQWRDVGAQRLFQRLDARLVNLEQVPVVRAAPEREQPGALEIRRDRRARASRS